MPVAGVPVMVVATLAVKRTEVPKVPGLAAGVTVTLVVALPMVIALAVDYGVWFNYRWNELQGYTPWQISLIAGKVIGLAAGTELAGLGAITLASYRGVSSMGVSITIGLLCCLTATLLVAPAIGLLLDSKRKT